MGQKTKARAANNLAEVSWHGRNDRRRQRPVLVVVVLRTLGGGSSKIKAGQVERLHCSTCSMKDDETGPG